MRLEILLDGDCQILIELVEGIRRVQNKNWRTLCGERSSGRFLACNSLVFEPLSSKDSYHAATVSIIIRIMLYYSIINSITIASIDTVQ